MLQLITNTFENILLLFTVKCTQRSLAKIMKSKLDGWSHQMHTEQRQCTVMFLCFWTDRSGQTVQTQIRLLLQEQSDQGLHFLQFRLHLLDALL